MEEKSKLEMHLTGGNNPCGVKEEDRDASGWGKIIPVEQKSKIEMLIKGLSDKPRSIWVNGREYPECVDRTALYFEALYFEEGWFMQKDGTVIVRLYDHSETELQVEM